MRRREFITLVAGAMVQLPFAAKAQEAGRIYRFGILEPFSDTPVSVRRIDELRRRGFIEGQNLTIYRREFGPHVDLVSQYAAELSKAQVDVIEAAGSVATRAAQQATKTIPIVGVADDMVGEGLVGSLSRPNGNTTGVSILATELDGKRQELLIEAVPGLRRMAALADTNATAEAKLDALQEAARAQHRAFNPSDCEKRGDRSRHRQGWGIGRHRAQRLGVTDAVRQCSAHYGAGLRPASGGDLSMGRNG